MSNQTAQITIDDRFFEVGAAQSSRYDRLWTIAKETIQNSQDAGASTINFEFFGDWVHITDDGPGMEPTGGIANFLRIGASEKNANGSATGFFSTAKVRICFIHKDWWIKTGHEFLSKSMLGQQSIQRLEEPQPGCVVAVQSKDGDWDPQKVRDYVDLCNPEIRVQINGQTVRRTYRRSQLKANFDWSDVYVNRGDKAFKETLIVRVNGLAMFTKPLYGVPAQVTVELSPEVSHLVLQENREDLVWNAQYKGETIYPRSNLDTFVRGLVTNPSSARPKSKTVLEFIDGIKRAVKPIEARWDEFLEDLGPEKPEMSAHYSTVKIAGQPPSVDPLVKLTMEEFFEMQEGGVLIPLNGQVVRNAVSNQLQWIDDAYPASALGYIPSWAEVALSDKREEPEDAEPDSEFTEIFPYDYVVKHESNRPTPHTKHARVLAAWKDVTDKLASLVGITSQFGVGLCVDQDARAEYVESKYGDYLLVDYTEFKLTGSQIAQTMKMIRLACHELTHALGYQDHDERFIARESKMFDTAMEHLTDLRECTKGLTVYSRGYGSE